MCSEFELQNKSKEKRFFKPGKISSSKSYNPISYSCILTENNKSVTVFTSIPEIIMVAWNFSNDVIFEIFDLRLFYLRADNLITDKSRTYLRFLNCESNGKNVA